MSGFSAGLTKIRPDKDTSKVLQNTQELTQDVVKGLGVKSEIKMLEKHRDDLKGEIDNLSTQRDSDFKQISSELNVLKKQKNKFLTEIKSVSEMLFLLDGAKGKGKVAFNEFFAGREDVLVNFSSAVNKRIAKQAKSLDERTTELVNEENVASEMMAYSQTLLNGAYNALHEVDEARQSLNIQARMVLKREEDLKTLSTKSTQTFMLSEEYIKNAKAVFANSREEVKRANEYVKKHQGGFDEKLKELKDLETKLSAKEEFQEKEVVRLSEWERGLKDKEGAIRRLAAEVKGWR